MWIKIYNQQPDTSLAKWDVMYTKIDTIEYALFAKGVDLMLKYAGKRVDNIHIPKDDANKPNNIIDIIERRLFEERTNSDIDGVTFIRPIDGPVICVESIVPWFIFITKYGGNSNDNNKG